MKKTLFLGLIGAILSLVGCNSQPIQTQQPVQQDTVVIDLSDPELGMIIHMCLMGGGENCDEYLNPAKKETYGSLVQEQCDMMPGMPACDVYFGS